MNYELMAKLLVEKNNTKFSAKLVQNIKLLDAISLIYYIENVDFLRGLNQELLKDIETDSINRIIDLIIKRIVELEKREFCGNGIAN
ncbi:MAG: hypothetical protein JW871_00085 [Endomicrobiales bacterium]|nr:hypothetical protein [Endomicrobiales bacterium]